jgi:CRISPR-associated protein Cas6
MSAATGGMLDLLFDVEGDALPSDYGYALYRAVAQVLPWLAGIRDAGIHPVRGAPTDRGTLLLSRRSKLGLRLPAERAADAEALSGRTLDVAGRAMRVGPARARALSPFATLYARFVVTGSTAELEFLEQLAALLRDLGTRAKFMCGQRRTLRTATEEIGGFSVMLHEVLLDESVYLQQRGLGGNRTLGCGILIPHKSIRAVRIAD